MGQNFLEGILKGVVIGGDVAALSWSITKMINAANVTKGNHEYNKTDSYSYNNMDGSMDGEKYSYGTIKEFEESYGNLGNEGVDHYYLSAPDGYGIAQDGSFYKKRLDKSKITQNG